MEGVPVLYGFLDRKEHGTDLRVWCRWCCHWHIHGAGGTPVGEAVHRLAHCYAGDSAYDDGGYWIEITDTPYSTAKPMVRAATHAQQRAIGAGRISSAVKRLRAQPEPRPL
ncbi:hypothetical protein [Actinacidiphila sp. ITFR-21]|uniref:hypothetical protein n=1 Tax=Actinacidiphila sp. ITFR-21 TaxID=3075199 RepID=UPI00288900CA|nr:hypothetical protein [Streptomyces sp. ITFR-21]WNI16939.1 hypothetical protein RLT57_16345 [Streptomyces sp. ITFR-21]